MTNKGISIQLKILKVKRENVVISEMTLKAGLSDLCSVLALN